MFKMTMFTLSLLMCSPHIQAVCLVDTLELGDIGPASQLVCDSIASFYPGKQIEIIDREISSQRDVTILLSIEKQHHTLSYQLVGADWKLNQPKVADHY
ncbi:MAG: hypothetical protein KZQ96_06820 [Candidatus Thiodiazotropha sp. (ex Lucinoma borealis)]|nr:hypothetical protein [Candidatus Thiodiazotropha sp. (ex Lucinoma borealis)]MCU7858130.1 hypothetical protein [Candidatus Thiodiazotropha sp. (ex Lucinoma borealis)]